MIKSGPKIVRRGFQIYNKLKHALEAEHYREYVAIEVKSGEYFLGRTMDEALELADGSKIPSAFYEGTIYWFRRKRKVWIHPTKSEDALLGTQMLVGYVFDLDVESNYVAITKKSARGPSQ